MPFYTPLRYPGGKRRLAPFIMRLLEENKMRDVQYVEPYAGGASLALALLLEEYASTIHINDLSRPVYAFWHAVINHTDALCGEIEKTQVNIGEWHRQRAVYGNQQFAGLYQLGFAAFFLNRTNRSGIIAGGVIGGKQQTGTWRIDARFNKAELIQRIQRIGRYRNRIRLYQRDALEFTSHVLPQLGLNTFVFYDPPYIEKGKDLYLNTYTVDDHHRLAARVMQLEQPWVVTYDYDAATRHNLYNGHTRLVFDLSYSAQERYGGKEVMFLSKSLVLPHTWAQAATVEMSAPRSDYPLFGRLESTKPLHDCERGGERGVDKERPPSRP